MYCQKRFNENNPDSEIEALIKNIFEEHKGNYGHRRIGTELRNREYVVNPKKVLRLMRELNIICIKFTHKSRKFSTYKGTIGKIAKNRINRRFNKNIPLQKITTDTTEFKFYALGSDGKIIIKKAYLDPFLDIFNGEVLSFRLSEQPNTKAVMDALYETIEKKIVLTGQLFTLIKVGEYQMKVFVKKLKVNNIFQSMSRKGSFFQLSVRVC